MDGDHRAQYSPMLFKHQSEEEIILIWNFKKQGKFDRLKRMKSIGKQKRKAAAELDLVI